MSGNLAQGSHHILLGSGKYSRSTNGGFVSGVPDSSVAKTGPSQKVGEHTSRPAQEGPKISMGTLPDIKPVIHTGDLAHNRAILGLHHRG